MRFPRISANTGFRLRVGASVGVPALGCVIYATGFPADRLPHSIVLYVSIASIALVLPPLGRWAFLLTCVGASAAMNWVSVIKVSLTGMPLTWTDFEVFAAQPNASLAALQFPASLNLAIVWGTAGLALTLLAWFVFDMSRASRRAARVCAFATSMSLCLLSAELLGKTLDAKLTAASVRLVHLETMQALERATGVAGFLAYSRRLAANKDSLFFERATKDSPDPADIRKAVSNFVEPKHATLAPNIVVLLAESTFDPNDAFDLARPFHSYLFQENELTQAKGLLRVNIFGGGTWISEFEFLTGLDSRLFGFGGLYSHVMLSPYVRRSLVHHLLEKGYSTTAYYATDAAFLEARRSFQRYGFRRDLDRTDLGFRRNEWLTNDRDIVSAAIRHAHHNSDGPFFEYVQLLENHSPHPCSPNVALASFVGHFAKPATYTQSCQLDAYLRRVNSTSEAVRTMVARLKDIEARTGRGFVVLIFGDHQPHTFTSSGFPSEHSAVYGAHRRLTDNQRTFYHLMASVPSPLSPALKKPDADILPLTLLPTLLSAYVAKDLDDVYLPANALAFTRFGADMLNGGAEPARAPEKDRFRARIGLPELVNAFRAARVMNFH